MDLYQIMTELESLGSDRKKKYFLNQGAKEPLFGVAASAMKHMVKAEKFNQDLAEELFATGNFDAMYLAGMIADPNKMTAEDYHRWVKQADFFMISDFIVAVTLAESDIAQEVADSFIESNEELVMSAGWSCYEWLLGSRKDKEFSQDKIKAMLERVEKNIDGQPDRTKSSMNRFLIAVGISYEPLHSIALETASRIGELSILQGNKEIGLPSAYESIQVAANKGRVGFKRKNVRC